MWRFLRRVLASRLGQLCAVTHLCLVLFDFSRKGVQDFDPNNCASVSEWHITGSLIAGRFFHYTYESTLHKLTVVFDLPALAASSVVTAPLNYLSPHTCVYTASWISAFVMLAFASFQWLLVGRGIERLFAKRGERCR